MSQNDDKGLPGLPVHGYRAQPAANVALVNEFKQDEERLLRKLDALVARKPWCDIGTGRFHTEASSESPLATDPRFVALARTHFQEGFMALNRAVFQPGRIALPEDEESK